MKAPVLAVIALVAAPGDANDVVVRQDFSARTLGSDWKASPSWRVEEGELRGEGSGSLAYATPVRGDFTLQFRASAETKANVEVKLVDPASGAVRWTFAFLGQYHPVLDGVKSAILQDDRFVKVEPKMWIWPGKTFDFEVRAARNQYQMFLDRELGPFFVDPKPPAEPPPLRLEIVVSTEGAKDRVRIDDVVLHRKR